MDNNNIRKGLEHDALRVRERILMAAKHEKAAQAIADLKAFMAKHKWSQTTVAKKLGVSTSTISQLINNRYKGNVNELIERIICMLDSLMRQDSRPRQRKFIQTTVAKKIYTLIKQTEAFSDDEGKIGLIIGDGGHGKSHCLREYAKVNKNTKYVELDNAMTPTTMFAEIADAVGVYSAGSLSTITRRLIDNLQNKHIIIMLDEASGLKVRQLDQLRQIIVIKCRCPLILAGNGGLLNTVMQPTTRRGAESLDQFTSRLMCILNLDMTASDKDGGLYSVDDMRKLYEYGGVRLTTDAVRSLRKICRTPRTGRLRTCSHIITALHTAGVIKTNKQITGDLITAAIDQLDLPVKARLPVNLTVAENDENQQVVSMAG